MSLHEVLGWQIAEECRLSGNLYNGHDNIDQSDFLVPQSSGTSKRIRRKVCVRPMSGKLELFASLEQCMLHILFADRGEDP